MKLKVFNDKEDKNVYLKLRQFGDEIAIFVVSKEGIDKNFLLTISKKGVFLCDGINKNLGFDLNEKGQLKIIE